MSDSVCVGHEPCPECGSRDNLARYDDGHGHCFGCGYYEKGDNECTVTDASVGRPTAKDFTMNDLIKGEHRRLPKRNITEETCKFLDYTCGEFNGKPVQIANYYDKDGKRVAQKVRFKNKDFLVLGNLKKAVLFGQQKFRDSGKRLLITEGEIDALTLSQLNGNKWPVVSIPNGAQGAAKAIAQNIEWIEKFESVIFAFDMDEPGRDAARECAALLSPGRAYIAMLPGKDANDCHLNGKSKQLIDAMWGAKAYRPDGVIDVESLVDSACAPIEEGFSWPWAGLAKTYGRRRCELYGFGGGTGCGKSTIFKQLAKHIIETDNLPVGMLMLEEPPRHTLRTMAGMFMGARVHVPGEKYSEPVLKETIVNLAGKVFFYDHFGAATFDTIKEKIRYMVRGLGIKDIFLDHLTALAATIDTDERKAIDKMMAELSSLVQELDFTLYYISHLTTPEGKPHEEGGRVLEKQFRGSRAVAYWSHFLFGIERDKQEIGGVTTFRVLKDRYTGDSSGVTFGLSYDKKTGLLNECSLDADAPFPPADGDY